ncbi:APC family permease [Nocardioides sp. SYSU D00038]|uniref:APC family permease n=1 Tax=Nocardioides sp. SYSU D00038 TaxID=2812554 RepID=UPI0019687082|nr:APC family permease [Nocardioides sp. SYSU D00038]
MTTVEPSREPLGAPATAARSERPVGTLGITAVVVSAAAPLMVLVGVAPLALAVAGPAAAAGYLVAGAVLALFAIAFTRMAARVPVNGGFHVYVGVVHGERARLATALAALLAYNALQVGVWGLFGVLARPAVAELAGSAPPWWVLALAGVLGVHLLGLLGLDLGARMLVVLVVVETGVLAVLVAGVLADLDSVSFAAFEPGAVVSGSTAAVLGICFAAFTGFESSVLFRAEARQPERSIPRATYLALGFMAFFDCVAVWVVAQAFGGDGEAAAERHGAALFAVAMEQHVGSAARAALVVLVALSALASQLAFHHAINRYTVALALDGVLPRRLAERRGARGALARAGTAQSALAVGAVVVVAAVGADPYRHLLVWVNTPGVLGVLALEALVAAAAARWLVREGGSRVRVAAAVVSSLLLVATLVVLVVHLDLLTGAAPGVNAVLVGAVPLAAVAAWLAAGRWRRVHAPTGSAHPGPS